MGAFIEFRKYLKTKYSNLFYLQRKVLDGIMLKKSIKKKTATLPQFRNIRPDPDYLRKCKTFLQESFHGFSNTRWHHYYSTLYGHKDIRFIPDQVYFTMIEPRLNCFDFSYANTDKISFDLIMDKKNLPETVFKIINQRFYNSDNELISRESALNILKEKEGELVLKPSVYTGGGRNIFIGSVVDIAERLQSSPHYRNGSFVVQEVEKQHAALRELHPHSLNTCRIMTARVENEFVVLSAYLRMGRNNSRVDNGQAGGIFCSIHDHGKISDFALDKFANRLEKHPDSGVSFAGFVIPGYEEARRFCLEQHRRFLRYTFISWDIGIREDSSPVFIEFNLRLQSINGHQIINGPLFGEHTGYFIQRYNEERKRDFYFI